MVSIIIPTYNRLSTLNRAIESVFNQLFGDFELIVIDDCSTDLTIGYLGTIRDSRLKIIQNDQNKGVSYSRNIGIKQSRFDWVAFLDSDDEWKPEKLLLQMESLRMSKLLWSHTNEEWLRNGEKVKQQKKHKKPHGYVFKECLPLCCISPSTTIVHKSIFNDIGLFDESLEVCEDYDLWLRISSKYPIDLVETSLVKKYAGHADQLSFKYFGMDRFRVMALENCLLGNNLNASQKLLVKSMIISKLKVLIKGYVKHNKSLDVKFFKNKLEAIIDR